VAISRIPTKNLTIPSYFSYNYKMPKKRKTARSLDEIAYKCGVYFSGVKKEVGHGKFLAWINANTRWTDRTVQNYMKYAEQCERAGCLLKYPTF